MWFFFSPLFFFWELRYSSINPFFSDTLMLLYQNQNANRVALLLMHSSSLLLFSFFSYLQIASLGPSRSSRQVRTHRDRLRAGCC
uniref:Putative secreted protein n=1 Tax=Anopheles darlingi TaxID=43151 RepID=A0A2M4DRS0_ANODA